VGHADAISVKFDGGKPAGGVRAPLDPGKEFLPEQEEKP